MIGINIVLRALKSLPKARILLKVEFNDVVFICKPNNKWAYDGNKNDYHWFCYTFGPRKYETCCCLLSMLYPLQIGFVISDDWESYAREAPNPPLAGKIFNQRIERNNLTPRTCIK